MPDVRVVDQFAPGDIDAIRKLVDAVERTTGTAPLGEVTWLGLNELRTTDHGPRTDVGLVVPGTDGALDGYAHAARHHDREWSLELAARPGAPDGRFEMLQAALAEVAQRGGGHVTMWVREPTADDDALATKGGLSRERDLLQLRVQLPLAERANWPAGARVRSFVPGADEDAWLVVNNRAFAGHPEQGNWTVDTLLRREAEPWFDPAGFLLAFDDATDATDATDASDAASLAGFCWTKVHPARVPQEPEPLGEIYVIGVDPAHQGTGLGRALVIGGLDSLARRGIAIGMLFVDADNTAAVGLYTALGFTTHRLDRAYGCEVEPGA